MGRAFGFLEILYKKNEKNIRISKFLSFLDLGLSLEPDT